MIRAQSLNGSSGFVKSWFDSSIAQTIQDRGEKMKMLCANVHCESRPEEIEPGLADFEIGAIQRLLNFFQQSIQFRMIVGQLLALSWQHAVRSSLLDRFV